MMPDSGSFMFGAAVADPSTPRIKAAKMEPLLRCPLCSRHVVELTAASAEVELPPEIEKKWYWLPDVLTRQRRILYTLAPCGCRADQEWAAAFAREITERVNGFQAKAVACFPSPVGQAKLKKQLMADIVTLYKMRDNDIALRECCQYALVMATHRLRQLNEGAPFAPVASLPVEKSIADWALKTGLTGSLGSLIDRDFSYGSQYKFPKLGKPLPGLEESSWPAGATVYEEYPGRFVAEVPGQPNRSFSSYTAAAAYLANMQLEVGQKLIGLESDWADKFLGLLASLPVEKAKVEAASTLDRTGVPVPAPALLPPDPKKARDEFYAKFKRSKRRIRREE
jgi:hypothetical protein